jgi:hypothetical protein
MMSKRPTTAMDAPMPAAAPVERPFEFVEGVAEFEWVVDDVFAGMLVPVGVFVPVGVLVADGV